MSRNRRIALLVAVLAQLAVPLALAGFAAADLAFGREIRLVARPVDPLDIFRGNYVVLSYDISRLGVAFEPTRGRRICARLHEENGVWNAGIGVPEGPPDGTFICGRVTRVEGDGFVQVEYGIETYFASAERAREIERELAQGPVVVVTDLDDEAARGSNGSKETAESFD
ncbi:MAG: GDYXXLXY domain-containing protein [Actinobacteria bacterium]|nr:GDYXXLXY domain-containing protein [Actinomycetota bacterium]